MAIDFKACPALLFRSQPLQLCHQLAFL